MKVQCNSCGCHFPSDFKDTLKKDCNFWKLKGCEDVAEEDREFLWNWVFSFPYDQWAIEKKLGLSFEWQINKITNTNDFLTNYEKYESMSEVDKQRFQKEWFKFSQKYSEKENFFKLLFFLFIKDWEIDN